MDQDQLPKRRARHAAARCAGARSAPRPRLFGFALSPVNQRPLGALQGAQARLPQLPDLSRRCSCVTLFAEFIANDRPLIASYKGEILFPVLVDYPEEKFGGFLAVTDYKDAATSWTRSTPTAG